MTKMTTTQATVYARPVYGVKPFEWAGKRTAIDRIVQEVGGLAAATRQTAHGGLEVSGATDSAPGLVGTTVTFKESTVRSLGDRLMDCTWDLDRRMYCRNSPRWDSWEQIVRVADGRATGTDRGGSTMSEDAEESVTSLPWSGRSMCTIRRVALSTETTGHLIKFTLTVTTTEPDEEVYFWLRPIADVTLDWGDGTQEVVPNGNEDYLYHTYAAAGTRTLTVSNATVITAIDIDDYWFSGFNSAQLRDAPMTYLFLYMLGTTAPCRVDSADMVGWSPDVFVLYDMPAGSYRLDTADMVAWTPARWNISNLPTGDYRFDSADMAGWPILDFEIDGVPAGDYRLDSVHMTGWLPRGFIVADMPAGDYHIDSADINMSGASAYVFVLSSMPAGDYRFNSADVPPLITLEIHDLPAGEYAFRTADLSLWGAKIGGFRASKLTGITWDITSDAFASWVYCSKCDVSDNGFSTAQVNAVLWGLYRAATIRETRYDDGINVGGTNAAPSGTFQAAASCPVTVATPGKEIAHELLNDGCHGIAMGRVWSSVIFTL